ncbi:unnamed protein product [Schistosoma turkestanicum]|nr:unnamed protein product [Schistosoma turkestanicum]
MQYKQIHYFNVHPMWKLSPALKAIRFWIHIFLCLIEIILTTILICKFCKSCKETDKYKWVLLGLIPSSIIFSLLLITVREMREHFPMNFIFLHLNTLLMCFAFIPPILSTKITYTTISFGLAAFILFIVILLGMSIKVEISPIMLILVMISFIALGLISSITLYFAHQSVAVNVMGAFVLLSVLPLLIFIGQQLKLESYPWMLQSDCIFYAVVISITYLFIFYSIDMQFFNSQH